MNVKTIVPKVFVVIAVLTLVACKSSHNNPDLNENLSFQTGWKYNGASTVGFEAFAGHLSAAPSGMLPIEGGSFTIGKMDEFITAPRNNDRRTLTVNSFYMDKYEITNLAWREYLHWNQVVFGKANSNLITALLPDTTVWRDEMAYTEDLEKYYFRSPDYSFYPVVGVSWEQAMNYCQWRTDRVNEQILIKGGYIKPLNAQYDSAFNGTIDYESIKERVVFNTEKYFRTGYSPEMGSNAPVSPLDKNKKRKLNEADGILLIGYRLPTEAEWEYAAFAPIAGEDGLPVEGKIYPWSGYQNRDISTQNRGKMLANFVRGKGDMMGIAGQRNDGNTYTARVDAYQPNDFGLYNMAGNVNEWVLDVYRETTFEEMTEYNPFRGNVYKRYETDSEGKIILDDYGCLKVTYDPEDDKRNYRDGDEGSLFKTDYPLFDNLKDMKDPSDILVPRIDNRTRVYKGGAWNDRIYWLNPTTRRYMQQDQSSSTVGFRCAMSILAK